MMKKMLCVSAGVLLLSGNAYSAMLSTNNAKHELDQLERRQNQLTIEEEKAREKEIITQKEMGVGSSLSELGKPGAGYQFMIKEINVEGDDIYDDSPARQKIIDRYINTKMGQYEIMTLVKELSDFYIGKGYSTSLVTIQQGNLREGILNLKVLWGKVADFSVEGKKPTFRESSRLFSAMPFAEGKPLNLQDIDQGLDNLLRVSRNDKLSIVPNEKMGYSTINLQGADVQPISGGIGTNNSGSEADGWAQYYASLNVNNPLGLNDVLGFYYSFNDLKNNPDNQDSWSINYSLPLGYWTWDMMFYKSGYAKTIGGFYGGYHSEGDSSRASLKLSRLLHRDALGKTSGYVKLETRDSANLIEGDIIDVSSKRYSSITAGVNRVGTLLGGWVYGDLNVTTGTPWFNAAWKDDADLEGFDLNYVKYNGMVNWSRDLYRNDHVGISYDMSSGFQYTPDITVSDAKFSVGDEFTVRGYKDSFMSVHSGAYLSNNLNFPVYVNKFGINQITPFIGYDLGVVKDNCPAGVDACHTQYMTGAAIGVKASGRYFNTSLTMSWPLAEPSTLRDQDVAESAIYYNIGLNF